jgi:hypothetical protein
MALESCQKYISSEDESVFIFCNQQMKNPYIRMILENTLCSTPFDAEVQGRLFLSLIQPLSKEDEKKISESLAEYIVESGPGLFVPLFPGDLRLDGLPGPIIAALIASYDGPRFLEALPRLKSALERESSPIIAEALQGHLGQLGEEVGHQEDGAGHPGEDKDVKWVFGSAAMCGAKATPELIAVYRKAGAKLPEEVVKGITDWSAVGDIVGVLPSPAGPLIPESALDRVIAALASPQDALELFDPPIRHAAFATESFWGSLCEGELEKPKLKKAAALFFENIDAAEVGSFATGLLAKQKSALKFVLFLAHKKTGLVNSMLTSEPFLAGVAEFGYALHKLRWNPPASPEVVLGCPPTLLLSLADSLEDTTIFASLELRPLDDADLLSVLSVLKGVA